MRGNPSQPPAVPIESPAQSPESELEQSGGPLPRPTLAFRKLDGNSDKRLSPKELEALPEPRCERFLAADQNGDGTVTLEELRQRLRRVLDSGQPQWAQTMLWMYDQDGDGALSRDELPRRNLDRLVQADRNGDGRIVEAELAEFQHAQRSGLK